jgi:hypothetical protein
MEQNALRQTKLARFCVNFCLFPPKINVTVETDRRIFLYESPNFLRFLGGAASLISILSITDRLRNR